MFARCSYEELQEALTIVNEKYLGNIRFYEDPSRKGRGFRFRLKTHDPREVGVARAAGGKRTGSGCWHAHGDFFEALLKVQPEAVVESRGHESKITKHGGNWEDYNIGSQAYPLDASEACDCEFSRELTGTLSGEKEIIQAIRAMNADQVERRMGCWDVFSLPVRSRLIIQHCAKEFLPLYLNNDDVKDIATKRLGKGKA